MKKLIVVDCFSQHQDRVEALRSDGNFIIHAFTESFLFPEGFSIMDQDKIPFTAYPNCMPSTATPLSFYDQIENFFPACMQLHIQMQNSRYGPYTISGRRFYEEFNLSYRLAHYFYEFFSKTACDELLFFETPVSGIDTLLYVVARQLKVTIKIDLNDQLEDPKRDNWLRAYEAQMKLSHFKDKVKKKRWQYFKDLLTKNYESIIEDNKYACTGSKLYKWKTHFQTLQKSAVKTPKHPYYYFPLFPKSFILNELEDVSVYHQLDCLEQFSRLVPDGESILVQETGDVQKAIRGNDFTQRLMSIPKVVLGEVDQDARVYIAEAKAVILTRPESYLSGLSQSKPIISFREPITAGVQHISFTESLDLATVGSKK